MPRMNWVLRVNLSLENETRLAFVPGPACLLALWSEGKLSHCHNPSLGSHNVTSPSWPHVSLGLYGSSLIP